jgi:hypothetical protein
MRYLLILLILVSTEGFSQCKTFNLTSKGDTINCTDVKGMKQGPWIVQVPELRGERGFEEEGYYLNDKKEGTWRRFSLEGDLIAVENYSWGMKNGRCFYYTNVGEPLREESWRAIDPKNAFDTVDITDPNDPTLILRKEIIKNEGTSMRHGTWKFYDPSRGTIDHTEQWVLNRPKKEVVNDDMAPIDVSEDGSTTAKPVVKEAKKPQAILDYEKKNSGKKKVKVRDGSTGGGR